jgi:hypothetical protein
MIFTYISGMNEKNRLRLLNRLNQKAFQSEVASLWPLARGSLTLIRKPCIRPGCPACAKGVKHSAYILMTRDKGARRCLYVPRDLAPILRQARQSSGAAFGAPGHADDSGLSRPAPSATCPP